MRALKNDTATLNISVSVVAPGITLTDLVSGGDAILLAARAHDSEHGSFQNFRVSARNQGLRPDARAGKGGWYRCPLLLST